MAPVINGTTRLSFIGNGKLSTNSATAAPTSAFKGFRYAVAAKKLNNKPAIKPSMVFPLLNGNGVFPKILPKIAAVLSPIANMVMAALFTGVGNNKRVSSMPKAKKMGAVANS